MSPTPVQILANSGLLAFASAALSYIYAFQSKAHQKLMTKLALGFCILGSGVIVMIPLAYGPKSPGIFILVASIGWLTVVTQLRFGAGPLGAFTAPFATLLLLVRAFFPDTSVNESLAIPPALLHMHVGLAALGQAFAILACVASLVFLWQQKTLKKRLISQLNHAMPALDKLTKILLTSLWAGFILITISLITGAVINQLFPGPMGAASLFKIFWATTVWLWYLATLIAKNVFNWPGKRIAQMSLGGFLLLTVAFFGLSPFSTAS